MVPFGPPPGAHLSLPPRSSEGYVGLLYRWCPLDFPPLVLHLRASDFQTYMACTGQLVKRKRQTMSGQKRG